MTSTTSSVDRGHLTRLLGASLALHAAFMLYGAHQDARSTVKYTDVDYSVFSDGARLTWLPALAGGKPSEGVLGGSWIGSPYARSTYRYTPLLAVLLLPNLFLHPAFGKVLFSLCDLLIGYLLFLLFPSSSPRPTADGVSPCVTPAQYLIFAPSVPHPKDRDSSSTGGSVGGSASKWKSATTPSRYTRVEPSIAYPTTFASLDEAIAASGAPTSFSSSSSPTWWISSLWLFNPLPINIATRGSSESLLGAIILGALYCLIERPTGSLSSSLSSSLSRSQVLGSVLFGLAVHIKIYPVVFAAAVLGYLGRGSRTALGRFGVCRKGIEFALFSGGTFAALTALCYLIWGHEAIYHPYLYHLHRLDHRHNFSPYFYPIYLASSLPSSLSSTSFSVLPSTAQALLRSPLASFLPQLGLSVVLGWAYGRAGELVMGWAIATAVFVALNKVVTSQYFIWYLSFLPLILPRVHVTRGKAFGLFAAWVLGQALWLLPAYNLEFLGRDVFLQLWAASIIFLGVNGWILGEVMAGFH